MVRGRGGAKVRTTFQYHDGRSYAAIGENTGKGKIICAAGSQRLV